MSQNGSTYLHCLFLAHLSSSIAHGWSRSDTLHSQPWVNLHRNCRSHADYLSRIWLAEFGGLSICTYITFCWKRNNFTLPWYLIWI